MSQNPRPSDLIPRHPDIPGQTGLTTGSGIIYCNPPDAACAKNAHPLPPPTKKKLPKVKEVHQTTLGQYLDSNGVPMGNEHPYRKGGDGVKRPTKKQIGF